MLALVAAALFALAFLLNATGAAVPAVIAPLSLLFLGLACLALHQGGVGTASTGGGRTFRMGRRR